MLWDEAQDGLCPLLSVVSEGKSPCFLTRLSLSWWFLQSRWVTGYQPGHRERVCHRMHQGFGSSSWAEP